MIEREGHLSTVKVETSRQYFISSLDNSTTSAEKFNQYLRGHWAIENRLHRQAFLWQLDFTFKEDNSKVRTDKGPANLHLTRKWALHLLKNDPAKISMKRKKAGRSIQLPPQINCLTFWCGNPRYLGKIDKLHICIQ